MTVYNNATQENIDYLHELTTFPKVTCNAWIDCEGQDDSNHSPTNPLNILYYGSARPLQTGHTGNGVTAIYHTAKDGLRDALSVLQLSYYQELRSVAHTKDPLKIADAIERSPWAASHYGWHGFGTGCISGRVQWLLAHDARYRRKRSVITTKAAITGDEQIDNWLKAIHTNIGYVNEKLFVDTTSEEDKSYQPYLEKIMQEANEIAGRIVT